MTFSPLFKFITRWLGSFSPAQIWLFTKLKGGKIGADQFGNIYHETKARKGSYYTRRWVIYKGEPEASAIPPEFHGWLHHQTDQFPAATNTLRRTWQKPYQPNLTGTPKAFHPPGYGGGPRAAATGDYEAWQPPA